MDILYLNDFQAVQWYFPCLHLHLKCFIIFLTCKIDGNAGRKREKEGSMVV